MTPRWATLKTASAVLVALAQTACAEATVPTSTQDAAAAAQTDGTSEAPWPLLDVRDHGEHAIGPTGETAAVDVPTAGAQRGLLIRARPLQPTSSVVCFAVKDVRDAAGALWPPDAPTPTATDASAGRQRGQVLALFPAEGSPSLPATGLRVRVGTVACADGTSLAPPASPWMVRVSSVALADAPGRARLPLQVAFAGGTAAASWQASLDTASALLADAGIDVNAAAPIALSAQNDGTPLPALAPLRLGPGLSSDVDALAQALDDALAALHPGAGLDFPALVVVVPCLDRVGLDGVQRRLRGHATRLPGGPRLPGIASMVLLGTDDCSAPTAQDAASLGRVLAHELGHLLGLRHAGLSAQPNLMADDAGRVDASAGFSPAQAAALRRSPLVLAP